VTVLAARSPFGVYAGAFATRNPVFTLAPNTVVGAVDLACARFAWADPATGVTTNTEIEGGRIGLVMPAPGRNWQATYWERGVQYIRAGKPCTVITSADLYCRFPLGGLIGSPVWVDPATGIPYAVDGGGYVPTRFTLVTDTPAGALGVISPYQFQG
jgi:hypothetical protein